MSQLHWGGGTPTFLKAAEISWLSQVLRTRVDFAEDCEYSIEIDPRSINDEQMHALIEGDINRMSLGVQDFHPQVQVAVNRIQPIEMTERVVNQARNAGDKSLSFELIHGLPHQTRERFASTMQIVLGMRRERIALYNYAHMPSLFKSQRLINEQAVVVMEEGRRKAMRFIASAFDSRQGRVAEPGRYSKAVSGIRTPIPKLCEDSLGAPAGPK